MSTIMITSASGAPGVTTTALGLTLLWPNDSLLVDADPHPSQAVLAGYLQGSDGAGRGLAALAGAQRGRTLSPVDLLSHCIPLSSETQCQRSFLPGFTRPGSHHTLAGAVPAVAQALQQVASGGTQVIIDGGRFGTDGPPRELMATVHTIGVITRTTLRALAALRLHLPNLVQVSDSASIKLILIGEGQPYRAVEIEEQFGHPVLCSIVDDPSAAAVLSDGAPASRRFVRGAYAKSLQHLTECLVATDHDQLPPTSVARAER